MAATRCRRTRNPHCYQIFNRQFHLLDSLQRAENKRDDAILIATFSNFSSARNTGVYSISFQKSAANDAPYFCVANEPCATLRPSRWPSGSRKCLSSCNHTPPKTRSARSANGSSRSACARIRFPERHEPPSASPGIAAKSIQARSNRCPV